MQTKINKRETPMPALLVAAALLLGATPAPAFTGEAPDLVLLVVVDQLRGDMPWRFRDRLGDGGFRYLMDQGISFSNARYRHAHTVTAAGHATLVTGGNAPEHGIPGNEWFDTAAAKWVYCLEDERSPEIGLPAEVAGHRSPRNLGSSTFGDELVLASAGRSRVFAASIKDRAAIIMGGHFGKAFWYSEISGRMISSAWYFESLPEWVQQWNSAKPADRYAGQSWSLLRPPESYVFIGQDDRVHERPEGGMGRVFPHLLRNDPGQAHYEALPYTPMGDELTLDFIKALVRAEQPGLRGHTDVLAVSFSVTDYVGHAFGPFSLEAEDNFLRLDRTLADLFRFIDREVGLEKTLVVLSSDHGGAPIPEFLTERGLPAGRHDAPRFMLDANDALQKRFGTTRQLAVAFANPSIYLDLDAVAELGLDIAAVEQALAGQMMKVPGIRSAYTRSDLLAGRFPDTAEARGVLASFHPRRSGDVLLVPEPFWYLSGDRYGSAATHGSPYAYDAHVPLMMAGPGVGRGIVHRPVAPRDLAPTISAYLGIAPPSGSVGAVLAEMLE